MLKTFLIPVNRNGLLEIFLRYITEPVSYITELIDGKPVCCHVDHIKVNYHTNWDYVYVGNETAEHFLST